MMHACTCVRARALTFRRGGQIFDGARNPRRPASRLLRESSAADDGLGHVQVRLIDFSNSMTLAEVIRPHVRCTADHARFPPVETGCF
eukprot:4560903-Pleurochrysis_carterae.AAC.2